jgi:hypothetical protein
VGEKPARLELDFDGFDSPVALGAETLSLEDWQERVVSFVQWAGLVPVRISGHAGHEYLADMVRFCHRLDMPTRVRTPAEGLTLAKAEELIDRGMMACEVVAPSVAAAEQAVRHLLHARLSRAAQLRVILHATSEVSESDRAIGRGLGIDDVVIVRPWRSAEGQPGTKRETGHCPVASLRVGIAPDGSVASCPFHTGTGTGLFPDATAGFDAHRAAIRACPRVCTHPTLS